MIFSLFDDTIFTLPAYQKAVGSTEPFQLHGLSLWLEGNSAYTFDKASFGYFPLIDYNHYLEIQEGLKSHGITEIIHQTAPPIYDSGVIWQGVIAEALQAELVYADTNFHQELNTDFLAQIDPSYRSKLNRVNRLGASLRAPDESLWDIWVGSPGTELEFAL